MCQVGECRPFLPPCLVVAVLSLLAMTNSAFMMVETHPRLRKQPKQAQEPASNGKCHLPEGKEPVSAFSEPAPLAVGGSYLSCCHTQALMHEVPFPMGQSTF